MTLSDKTEVDDTKPSPLLPLLNAGQEELWKSWEGGSVIARVHPSGKLPGSPSTSVEVIRKREKTVTITRKNDQAGEEQRNLSSGVRTSSSIDAGQLRSMLKSGAWFALQYVFDVLKTALSLSRRPLGVLFCAYLLSTILALIGGALSAVISPFCWVPGLSRLPLCFVTPDIPKVPKWGDYPTLVEVQSSRFEQLLDESVGNSRISLDIKRAEMATSDLITLVRISDFKNKNALAEHLTKFSADARKTGRGLQRLSSRIAGAVDNIIAVNDYALHTIEGHRDDSFFSLFSLWPTSSHVSVQEVVRETFTTALSVLEVQIRRIVLEAECSLRDLMALDEQLYTLSEFVARENGTLVEERMELLGTLWTLLGGNKRKLRHMDGHLLLLSSIGEYRHKATLHVTAALQTLQGMSEDMEDLRERVAAPELVGERIPVEVHMRSIRTGLERLQADRERTSAKEEEVVKRILGTAPGVD